MNETSYRSRTASVQGIGRRRFLQWGALGLAGLPFSCAGYRAGRGTRQVDTMPEVELQQLPFPVLKVSGTPRQIGRAIGQRFAWQIREGLKRRSAWFAELRTFMQADLDNRYWPFLQAARRAFPETVEELEGWAEGSGVDFADLMALNLKAELGAMMHGQRDVPGCSTISLVHGDRCLLTHNEDGDKAYADLMFFLHISQPGKPAIFCLSYPGILPGNAPAMNEDGLILTTNYIPSTEWKAGIPRYFLDRAVLDARNLDQAIRIAVHPDRAFAFHFNLGSVREKKLLSVETSVYSHDIFPIHGLYIHTNHLSLPSMQDMPQDEEYKQRSSVCRYRVLSAWKATQKDRLDQLTARDLVAALSSHEGAPYSPCRHPTEAVSGLTLACSQFDLNQGTWLFYKGNPCHADSQLLRPFPGLSG